MSQELFSSISPHELYGMFRSRESQEFVNCRNALFQSFDISRRSSIFISGVEPSLSCCFKAGLQLGAAIKS